MSTKTTPNENEPRLFSVPIKFTFCGTVEVLANSQEESNEIVQNSFSFLRGEIHESDSRITNWSVDTHPTRVI